MCTPDWHVHIPSLFVLHSRADRSTTCCVSIQTRNPFKEACCVTVPGTAVTAIRVTSTLTSRGRGGRGGGGKIDLGIFLYLVQQSPLGQGLLIHDVSRSHTTTHYSRQDSSEKVMSSSQRPLPDNEHNTHNRHPCPRAGFEPAFSTGERLQTYALDRAATRTGDRRYQEFSFTKESS